MKNEMNKYSEVKLLIFDADDTLWESALYFRRAEQDFVSLMVSLGFNPDEIRLEIRRKDIERLSVTGYGARPYIATLKSLLYDRVKDVTPYMIDSLDYISLSLLHHPLVLLPGVIDCLQKLYTAKKKMIVYTMGEEDHQRDKLQRSGIARFFDHCTVVPVKNEETMKQLLASSDVKPIEACMIGNSPRSDINPAIGCGVNALYFKRVITWQAEQIEITEPGLVTTVTSLPDILPVFGVM